MLHEYEVWLGTWRKMLTMKADKPESVFKYLALEYPFIPTAEFTLKGADFSTIRRLSRIRDDARYEEAWQATRRGSTNPEHTQR